MHSSLSRALTITCGHWITLAKLLLHVWQALLVWSFPVRIDVPEAFPCREAPPGLSPVVCELIASGKVVVGDSELLRQIYHEGDLLGPP